MRFLLEKDSVLKEEIDTLKSLLNKLQFKLIHEYVEIHIKELDTYDCNSKTDIPVGSISFVELFLKKVSNKESLSVLEIPLFLRKESILNRKYEIVTKENIPKTGTYFIKCVNNLKVGTPRLINCSLDEVDGTLFAVSEPVCTISTDSFPTIDAEYRVLVHNGVAQYVGWYDGLSVLHFPDSSVITEAINLVTENKATMPSSYTLDFAVNEDKTYLLEMHNFICCGTYGYTENNLVYMYINGIQYELATDYRLEITQN